MAPGKPGRRYRETAQGRIALSTGRFGYGWITLILFLLALSGQWICGWFSYRAEQRVHGVPAEPSGYILQMGRDTLENWQSEFLGLIWQVSGLAFLLFVGSPQSREGDERQEAKLDAILRKLDPHEAEAVIAELDARFRRL